MVLVLICWIVCKLSRLNLGDKKKYKNRSGQFYTG